ncbi:PAS domain-containing protein [Halanaeroarchaeum sp. HSR-CO]|uniref:PAS domain-containing protein n=1 Tax=Halanaeroarchaeum sp. HSR-CO TaxID=2866382 RepID=UPI00217D9197|nr:PAS domain-containing protein [Halanaeroarchaeum sp. HSR-CO]
MESPSPEGQNRRSPQGITALYVIFGVTWILVTDVLLSAVFASSDLTATAQMLKGLFFVGGTGLVLFALLQRRDRRIRANRQTLSIRERTIENAVDPIAAIDRAERYLFANEAYRELHGLSEGDVVGRTLESVLGETTYRRVSPHVETALEGGVATIEAERTHPRSGTRVLETRVFPLTNDDGEVAGVGATMRDITEQQDLERELRTTATRYRTLFDSIRDAILVADTDRRIVDCNQAFTDVFGYDRAEIEGEPTDLIYADSTAFEGMGAAIEAHEDDPSVFQTVQYETKAGRTFPGETSVFYHRDETGEITGFIGMIRDVSDRRHQLRQVKLLDTMLRHTVNNDMNVVMGYADLVDREVQAIADGDAIDTETVETVSEASEIIRDRCDRLVDAVEDQRSITRLLSDPPTTTEVDLVPRLQAVVDRARDQYPDASIQFEAQATPTVSAVQTVDQALQELVENAIEHATDANPAVDVVVDVHGDVASVAVADEGPPIPAMERHVLTGERDITQLYHGSGLGLWQVLLLVEQSDGTLEFGENDPRGNEVSIILPLADDQ